MGSRKKVFDKDLCLYAVETNDDVGESGVSEQVIRIIRECVSDKIFSENPDYIALVRDDIWVDEPDFDMYEVNASAWDLLRDIQKDLQKKRKKVESNPMDFLHSMLKMIARQAREEIFEAKKMLFFGSFNSDCITDEFIQKISNKVNTIGVDLSIILPETEHMTSLQRQNMKLLKKSFDGNEKVVIVTLDELEVQLANTLSKKFVRSMPWNAELELGPDFSINVSGYVCTRVNKVGAMEKGYKKDLKPAFQDDDDDESSVPASVTQVVGNDGNVEYKSANDDGNEATSSTVLVDKYKDVIEQEEYFLQDDGSEVNPEDIGKAFCYADKIVPAADLEDKNMYKSGPKCLKLLLFCKKEDVNPWFFLGDGTTHFYPKKGDNASEACLDALIRAMHENDRVAIARKVYREGTRVVLGVLAADMEQKCLVFTQHGFSDDISIPHFEPLINDEGEENIGDTDGVEETDTFIDDYIKAHQIEDFSPLNGPVDPAIKALRAKITEKLVGKLKISTSVKVEDDDEEQEVVEEEEKVEKPLTEVDVNLRHKDNLKDNLQVYFEQKPFSEETLQKIKDVFELTYNVEEKIRPTGDALFGKRHGGYNNGNDGKRVKLEDPDEDDLLNTM